MSDKIIHLTDDSFDTDVLKADGAILVDFWAEWCGPCKMIAPILDEIADEYQGKLTVAKLNIDQNPRHCAEIWHPWYPDSAAVQKTVKWRQPKWVHCLKVS